MKDLNGIEIKELQYGELKLIGTLLFDAYPSTIVYSDSKGLPVIKEWVDCSDNNQIDRFFYYSVSRYCLKRLIEGEISHLELINSSTQGYVFFEDEEYERILSTSIVSIKSIPKDYLPNSDFMFNRKDGVDTDDIITHFNLNDLVIKKEAIPHYVQATAIGAKSETIYIHLEKGKGVGYGTIKTEILGKTLLNVDKLYKSIALDYLKGKDRGEIHLDSKSNKEYSTYTDTEIYGDRIAASYGFLIRPVSSQLDWFPNGTPAATIANNTINLLNHSKEKDLLKNEYLLHSGYTIKLFEEFLKEIYKQELSLDLNWFNPVSKNQSLSSMDYINANKVLIELKELSLSKTNDIKMNGKFRAVDCDTWRFAFVGTDEQKFGGYFHETLKDRLNTINFIDVYSISIKRETIKEAGKQNEITKDTINSFELDK